MSVHDIGYSDVETLRIGDREEKEYSKLKHSQVLKYDVEECR